MAKKIREVPEKQMSKFGKMPKQKGGIPKRPRNRFRRIPKKKRGEPARLMNKFSNKYRVLLIMLRRLSLSVLNINILMFNGKKMTLKNCQPLLKKLIEMPMISRRFLESVCKDNFFCDNYYIQEKIGKFNKYFLKGSKHQINNINFFSKENEQLKRGKLFMRNFLSFLFRIIAPALMITFFGEQNIQGLDQKYINQAAILLKLQNYYSNDQIKDLIRNPSNKELKRLIKRQVKKIDPKQFDYETNEQYKKYHIKSQISNQYLNSLNYDSKFQQNQEYIHTLIVQSKAFKKMKNDDKIPCLFQLVQLLQDLSSNKQIERKVKKNGSLQKVKTRRHKPSGIYRKLYNNPDDSNERKPSKPSRMNEDFIQQPQSEMSWINFTNLPVHDEFNLVGTKNKSGYQSKRESKMQESMNQPEEKYSYCQSDFEFSKSQEPQIKKTITRSEAKRLSNISNTDREKSFKVQQETRRDLARLSIPPRIFSMKLASSTQSKRLSVEPNNIQSLHESSNLLQQNFEYQILSPLDEQQVKNKVTWFSNKQNLIFNHRKRKDSLDLNLDSSNFSDEIMSIQQFHDEQEKK